MNRRKVIFGLLFLFIILLALFPRSIDVLNSNPIFGIDQGREMLAAQEIVEERRMRLIGTAIGASGAGISGLFHGPGYYYMLALPYMLFSGNPVGGVFMMLALSLLTVLAGFYFGKRIWGIYGGITVALLVAISPTFIAQARFLWSPNLTPLFILLSFIFTYHLSKKKPLYIFLASFFAAFVYNFELAIAVPMSLALVFYSVFLFRRELKNYLYLLIGFLIGYLPMLFFEIRHGFMGLNGLVSYITNPVKTESVSWQYTLSDHFQYFIYNFKDTFPIDNYYFAFGFAALLLSLAVFFLRSEKKEELKHFITFLLFLIPVNFGVFFFLKNTVWNYYLTDLTICYVLILTYVAFRIYDLKLFKDKSFRFTAFVLIIVFAAFGALNAIKVSAYDYSDYGGTAKLKGKIDAIDYIYENQSEKPFGLLVFSPAVYTDPYDYILTWHGQKKYNYIPYNDKRGTFYLLVEPDQEKPWSYKGWLETVIKTGRIEWTKTLPSGFIVQKRTEK